MAHINSSCREHTSERSNCHPEAHQESAKEYGQSITHAYFWQLDARAMSMSLHVQILIHAPRPTRSISRTIAQPQSATCQRLANQCKVHKHHESVFYGLSYGLSAGCKQHSPKSKAQGSCKAQRYPQKRPVPCLLGSSWLCNATSRCIHEVCCWVKENRHFVGLHCAARCMLAGRLTKQQSLQ